MRATAQITPAPVIHGFSEIASGMNTTTASNGRPIFQFQEDLITDDIYLHNGLTSRNERISISKFGFPTNYRVNTNMPSHRFPSLSGDGRYIFFSSDAGGQGGLIFGNSNQLPIPATDNNRRDIFVRDMKSFSTPQSNATISLKLDIFEETNYTLPQGQQMPIIVNFNLDHGYADTAFLYVDNQLISRTTAENTGTSSSQIIIPWRNIRQGYSKLHVIVVDNFGNSYLSPSYDLNIDSPNKEVMSGTLNLNPSLGRDSNVTRGSSLSAHFLAVNSNGKASALKKVVFYLNGEKIKTDLNPPYSVNFSPPSFSEDNKTVLTDWVLSAQAIPLNGTSLFLHRFGIINNQAIFPNTELKIISGSDNNSSKRIYDGQSVGLQISVTGTPDILLTAVDQHIVINGILSSTVSPNLTFNANGDITQVNFYPTFIADFAKFAEPDGSIEITSFGELSVINNTTPIYQSNTINLTIASPIPWLDPISNGVSIFNDFSDSNLSNGFLELFREMQVKSQNPLADWTEYLTELGDFQTKIDMHAAHHIAMGDWHDSFIDYEKDFSLWVPDDANSSNLWLMEYINSILSGSSYISKYGQVPFLVGSEFMGKIHNFGLNRRSFAEQCLKNKYSYNPSFLQMNQSSVKMLNYWGNFEPGYWEFTNTQIANGDI
ncbi:MAG: Ig-like domain-containing protein, partial [Flammeovirgaceae bacterium]|nr:Ig-like domain-containing protein [Flammeovirgaceae bacterium]